MGFFSSLFGSSKSAPATTTNVISQKLPSEIAPYATEVLTEAKDLYAAQKERGYDPYTGETIAPLTPEQQQAMTGIAGLVGTSQPLQQEALDTFRQGGEQFTGDIAQQYMSPYQQAVTDIELREAQNKFDTQIMPQFEAAAVGAGGMSGLGSRAGVQAAELQRGQSQLLADIQAKGTQGAYKDAQKAFEDQKAREQQMGTDVSRMGPAMLASGLQEQGALQSVGEQKQQLGQSALDEAYYKFLEEQQYPQQQLANYSGFVYGNPAAGMVNQSTTGTSTPYQPSFGQTILGLGSGLASSFLGSSGGSAAVAKKLFNKEGGKVSDGLSGLVRREEGGTVGEEYQPRSLMGDIRRLGDYVIPTAEKINRAGLQTIGDIFTGEAFGIPDAVEYITGDPSQSASEKTVKEYIPSYRTREDSRKLELARARETLKNLAAKKEEPTSVDTKTPAVPEVVKPKPKVLTKEERYKKEGIKSEELRNKEAKELAQQKEDLVNQGTEFGVAEGMSDVLAYIAQRALTGKSKMDFFTKRQESQKEAEKLLTITKLKNLDAVQIAKDLGYKAESELGKAIAARISKIQNQRLKKTDMLAKIKKTLMEIKLMEIKNVSGGTSGFSFSKLPENQRVKAATSMIKNISTKLEGTPEQKLELKQMVEKIDDDVLKSIAQQLVIAESKGANPDQVITTLLKPLLKKQQGK